MKTFRNTIASPYTNFIVTPENTNNTNALLPNKLYAEMEGFVTAIISEHAAIAFPTPQLHKLQLLKNAYLNDHLTITGQIKKLDKYDLYFTVTVSHKENLINDTICKAIFKFQLTNSISMAS